MFILDLSPMRRDDALTLHRAGDVLTINGTPYDFGPLPEGGLLPRDAVGCDWIVSDVTRAGGVLRLTLILPHGPIPHPVPFEAVDVLFPAPIHVTADGPVALPEYTPPEEPLA